MVITKWHYRVKWHRNLGCGGRSRLDRYLRSIPFVRAVLQEEPNKTRWGLAAFVVAFAVEMFGVPFSMYALGWLFGIWLPEGLLWGHTLGQYIGLWGMYIGIVVMLVGFSLVILGWKQIHKEYRSLEERAGWTG